MRKYRLVAKKGEGTFSEVLKAQNIKDGKYRAIKCMKNRFESIDQVNNLREIQALRRLSPHEHIVSLEEVLYDQPTGRLALVFELMDANLYELIKGRRHYLNPQLVKMYMWQLMKALDHMHRKGIFHRDIKPENILIESNADIGRGLKLADFGSCRGIYSKQPYTEYISTRWYRAPECLLTDGYYGPEMDLWGTGCVMFEITSLYPLFPGSNELDQINRIHKVLGTPSEEILQKFKSKGASHISFDFPPQKGIGIPQLIPHATPDTIDLIIKLIKYDAADRISARESMRHPYFKEARESDAKRALQANAENPNGSSSTTTTSNDGGNGSQHQDQKKKGVESLRANASDLNPSVSNNNNNGSNSNNNNKPLVKTLPSIGQNGSLTNENYALPTQDNIAQITHNKIITGSNVSSTKHNTTLPLFNTGNHLGGGNVSGGTSSLPPIAGSNVNSGDQSSRSNRSLQQQSSQKKKKKTTSNKSSNSNNSGNNSNNNSGSYNNSQQLQQDINKNSKKTGEQVLRTYGLVVNGSNSDELKSSGNIQNNAGANSNTFATQNYLVNRNKYPTK